MRVLVTGSSGRIGTAVAKLVSQQANCIGVDIVPGPFTTHLANITDPQQMKQVFSGVEAVIHCAAFLTPHVGNVEDSQFRHVNVHGTKILLDLALRHSVKRFVLTSTTSVYGCTTRQKESAVWVTEQLEPNPEDIYDLTKLEAEALCSKAAESGLSTTILRMSRCFPEPPHLQVFYRLYRGVSSEDVAKANWLAVIQPHISGEIFNISADTPFIEEETAVLYTNPWTIIEQRFPGSIALYNKMGWDRPSQIDRVYVIEKAKKLLNFQPQNNYWDYLQEIRTESSV